ncbi:MAG: DUF4126 family protein [Oceanicaulis sp.]
MLLLIALGLGFASGLRTFTPLAVFSGFVVFTGLTLQAGFAWLGSIWAFLVLALLALAEFAGDKAATAPPRTSRLALGARLIAGAAVGTLAASFAGAGLFGAVLGALGAFAGAHAGQAARSRMSARIGGNRIAGAVEDAVTVLLSAGLVYALIAAV